MAQRVRADVMSHSAFLNILVNHSPDRARGDARPLIIQKQSHRVALLFRSFDQQLAAHAEIFLQSLFRLRPERHYALLPALAAQTYSLVLEIHIVEIDPREFCNTAA